MELSHLFKSTPISHMFFSSSKKKKQIELKCRAARTANTIWIVEITATFKFAKEREKNIPLSFCFQLNWWFYSASISYIYSCHLWRPKHELEKNESIRCNQNEKICVWIRKRVWRKKMKRIQCATNQAVIAWNAGWCDRCHSVHISFSRSRASRKVWNAF